MTVASRAGQPENPLVVQDDRTILLEVRHKRYDEARTCLAWFAELVKSPEYVHFYRVHPISVWNAAALGVPLATITASLVELSRWPVPPSLLHDIETWYRRYGALRFSPDGQPGKLWLSSPDRELLVELAARPSVREHVDTTAEPELVAERWALRFSAGERGVLKQALVKLGFPVEDLAGYQAGAALSLALRATEATGPGFALRPYQAAAAQAFWAGGSARGGCGVIVLPCGAGKTVVGLAVLALLQTQTLVLTTNTVAVRQWRAEVLAKTTLQDDQVGEYTGDVKQIRPVTVATYQVLTWRRSRTEVFPHFELLDREAWGLIIYDEVHLLPAPVFRATASIQARRRLGLTATLVREDGKEDEVFSLIGPKRFEVPWRELERQGFLAAARCVELRVPFTAAKQVEYAAAGARARFRLASVNGRKMEVVARLFEQHANDRVLVIGQYLEQLRELATVFRVPLITGATPNDERERRYAAFRAGAISRLVVSKVGNFAIDLPDANVAIQISGTFGSRQEEAQRLGRVLRPKSDGRGASFYSVVTDGSCEQEFAARRQLFLTEQGYGYEIAAAASFGLGAG